MPAILDQHGNAFTRVGGSVPTPYEAGGQGRRLRGWMASGTGPNDSATGNAQTLRNRSRQQYRNNGYAQSGINKLVSNIIGTGIKPRSAADDKGWQRAAQMEFESWGEECDPEGVLGIYGLQAQAVNAWLQGGECFIRKRDRRDSDGLSVPLQIQVMEAEMCPVNYSGSNPRNGNAIRRGIEYNRIGRRAAYWFYKSHPGDGWMMGVDGLQLTRVKAEDVIHLFDPVRAGQTRGIIKMAPVLLRMYDVDKYDDATLMRQQIANLYAGFVTNQSPDNPAPLPHSLSADELDASNDDPAPIEDLSMEPGVIQELLAGQDIKFASPPDAGSTYGDFMRQQLMAEAAGLEIPYEVLTGDFSKINDRTARVVLNQFYRRVQQWQQHIVVHQMCRRIWADWFLPKAILTNALSAPGFDANPEQYTRAKHIPQAWQYIHPVQDVQSDREAVRAGFKTRGDVISERRGEDIDDVDARQAMENTGADDLDLVHDTDPRQTDNSGKRVDAAPTEAEQTQDATT